MSGRPKKKWRVGGMWWRKKKKGLMDEKNVPAREGPRGYIGLAELGLFHGPLLLVVVVVVYSVCTLEAPGVCGRADPGLLFLEYIVVFLVQKIKNGFSILKIQDKQQKKTSLFFLSLFYHDQTRRERVDVCRSSATA